LANQRMAESYPSSYDLRSTGKLTPVRNQNPYGTCWTFASYGSLECSLLPGETWDFSEDNLVNTHGFDVNPALGPYNRGGNADMALAYLARWSGPVLESDDPYPSPGIPVGLPVQKHLQEALFHPGRSGPLDNDAAKAAVTTYGAVYTSIYMSENAAYYNSGTKAFYYTGNDTQNHAVAIVGWDDNYAANQFSSVPAGNGAFIVRNSWGTGWGENGYFYVSYYDTWIGKELVSFNLAESASNYGAVYQYDPLGQTSSFGYGGNTAWFANIFRTQSAESLAAVSFYTPQLNSPFEIYIYDSFNGSSFAGLRGSKIGSISSPGYHTVSLNSPIPFPAGDDFCVVVKLTTPGYSFPVPMEYPISGYSSQATAHAGESYVSSNGVTWADLTNFYANTNVCLKAFTVGGAPPSPTITVVSPNGGESWTVNDNRAIQWSFTGLSGNVKIELSRNGGSSWETLFASTTNDGSGPWTVAGNASNECRVKISSLSDPSVSDLSDGNFTINLAPPAPTITVVSPNGGESWTVGDSRTLQWSSANLSGDVKIELSRNGGSSWETLFASTANDGSQSWTVSGAASTSCRVRVSSVASPVVSDISAASFTIAAVTPPSPKPVVSTIAASEVGSTSARLNGEANPQGYDTLAWYQWGTDTGYGYETIAQYMGLGSGTLSYVDTISGLSSGVTYHFRAVAENYNGRSYGEDRQFSTTPPSPTITMVSPNGGESWTVNDNRAIQWSSTGLSGNVKIELSRNGGSSWETLFASTTNDGNQSWTVSGAASASCRVRVSSVASPAVSDTSVANFTIAATTSEFVLHLSQDWNMISLPLTTSASPSAVFGGLPAGWMLFSWNPLIPGYLMNDQVALEVGKGYWLKSPSTLDYVVSGERFNQLKTVPLTVGWNMVGLPYLKDANWGDVHISTGSATYTLDQAGAAGIIGPLLLWWDGNTYQIANQSGSMEPGKGYWLQAKQACELLFSPVGILPPPPPPGTP
jgi:C1A family cysteine protease